MKFLSKILSAIVLLIAINSAAVANMSQLGFYLEGNAGINLLSADFNDSAMTKRGGLGLNVNGGYQFNQYFATEIGVTRYRNIIDSGESVTSYDAAVKGIIPIDAGQFSLFGKVGVSSVEDPLDGGSIFLPFLGVGGSASIVKNLDFTVQLAGLTLGVVSLGMLSGGLIVHFA